jgi:hypothetical protein
MIEAFRPKEAAFYTLFVAFIAVFYGISPTTIFPAVLLILASSGFESFHRSDINKIYGTDGYSPDDKLSIFRISIFLATLAVLASFYFGFSYWYILLAVFAFSASAITQRYQFVSDLLLSLLYPAILVLHSPDTVLLAPVYWFVFFYELSVRSTYQLTRPFGMENLNLPQILGPETAASFVLVIDGLVAFWPVLMARYFAGLAFFAFSLSSMFIAAAIYALSVSHLERSRFLVKTAGLVFLAALWASELGLGF